MAKPSLYASRSLWHVSVVRLPLPFFIFAALALVGCSSPQKKAQQAEKQSKQENTRVLEQRRMLAIENGEVNSNRGAEIFMPSPDKTFDPNKNTASAVRNYSTKGASTKTFDSDRQLRLDTYQAHAFADAKSNEAAKRKFATKDADAHGYLFSDKKPGDKTMPTKAAWDAKKSAPSRELSDARRQDLGPESKKLNQKVDPKSLGDWRSTGESVVTEDGAIDKISTLKPLSIDDIRDLLNKTK